MENEARRILEFLGLSERLKRELRHSWLSDGRRESVAEHTWQMALVALLAHRPNTLVWEPGQGRQCQLVPSGVHTDDVVALACGGDQGAQKV
jgi:hypothetical protein